MNFLIILKYIDTFTPKSDIQVSVKLEKINDLFDNYVVYSKIQKQKVSLFLKNNSNIFFFL